MSELALTRLKDRTSGDSCKVLDAVYGTARAWVNFQGTGTVSIRDSYNVSSVTDNGTGDYTLNLTNPLSNANYVITGVCAHGALPAWTGSTVAYVVGPTATPTTTAARIGTGHGADSSGSGTTSDNAYIQVAIFGDPS